MSKQQKKDPKDNIICFCYSVSEQTIIDAIEQGANTPMDIRRITYANTGCRGCIEDIRRLLKKHIKIREDKTQKEESQNISYQQKNRAIFLDRDGTLNFDPGYIGDPALVKVFPGVSTALKKAKDAGFLLVVISNQSGIARGLINPQILPKIHHRFNDIFWQEAQVKVDSFQICPHHPDEACDCRKPKPKLLIEAAKKLQIDLSQSYMIGDSEADMGAGQAAGCKTILVRTGKGAEEEAKLKSKADFIADDLAKAIDWILA